MMSYIFSTCWDNFFILRFKIRISLFQHYETYKPFLTSSIVVGYMLYSIQMQHNEMLVQVVPTIVDPEQGSVTVYKMIPSYT